MGRPKTEWEYYECPYCGPSSRFSMRKGTFLGGGCVGPKGSHKAKAWVKVEPSPQNV